MGNIFISFYNLRVLFHTCISSGAVEATKVETQLSASCVRRPTYSNVHIRSHSSNVLKSVCVCDFCGEQDQAFNSCKPAFFLLLLICFILNHQ